MTQVSWKIVKCDSKKSKNLSDVFQKELDDIFLSVIPPNIDIYTGDHATQSIAEGWNKVFNACYDHFADLVIETVSKDDNLFIEIKKKSRSFVKRCKKSTAFLAFFKERQDHYKIEEKGLPSPEDTRYFTDILVFHSLISNEKPYFDTSFFCSG